MAQNTSVTPSSPVSPSTRKGNHLQPSPWLRGEGGLEEGLPWMAVNSTSTEHKERSKSACSFLESHWQEFSGWGQLAFPLCAFHLWALTLSGNLPLAETPHPSPSLQQCSPRNLGPPIGQASLMAQGSPPQYVSGPSSCQAENPETDLFFLPHHRLRQARC